MLFPRFILRPMLQSRLRTALTALGVMLGVAVMLAIQMANQGSLRGFSAALDAVSGKAALEITAPPLGVDENLLPGLSWLRDYGVVAPVIEADVMAEAPQGSEMLRIIGVDALRDPALRDYALGADLQGNASGMQLMAFLGEPDSLVLAGAFARRHALKTGDSLRVRIGDRTRDLQIAAVLESRDGARGSALAAQSIGIMDIAHAQVALDRAGRLDRLELRLHEGLPVAETETAVRARLPESLTLQRPARRGAAVEKMLAAFHFNLTMLSGIALVVGVFLIYNTISVAVMTRRREVGMLRTLGVTRGQVLRLFMGEALLLGLAGAVAGVPLAKLLAEGAVLLTATTVDTLYVATAAQVPPLGWLHWLAGVALAVPLSFVAAALPALEASRISPVEAMRGADEAAGMAAGGSWRRGRSLLAVGICALGAVLAARQPAVAGLPLWGYFTCLCAIAAMAFLVPLVLGAGARLLRPALGRVFGIEGRLAASQIQASTRRLAVSVAALAVSLALTVAIAVMVGSFRATVLYWVGQSLGADLYVRPGTPPRSQRPPTFSAGTVETLRAHPAVAALDGYRALDLPYGDRVVKLGTGDFDIQLSHGKVALKTPGDAAAIVRGARERGEVLISESFALRFQVKEGDEITLTTQKGPRAFRIAAQFYDYSNDSGTITMDTRLFEQEFGAGQPTHIAIFLKPGSDAEKVRDELVAALQGRGFVAIFTNAGLRSEILRIFDSTFAITWALEIIAVLVAMAGVAATMLTLVLERREEIRLLRIAGADAGQVRRTVVLESGILGAVSQVLGLAVGILLSLVLIHVINPQSFGWSIQFYTPWWFLAGSTVLTVAGTMVAGLYPAWRVTRGRTLMPAAAAVAIAFVGLAAPGGVAHAQESGPGTGEEPWKPSLPGYGYAFPRDHGQHPEHKIEWWYFTGNAQDAGGRRLGWQLTFFRIGARMSPAVDSPWALRDVWMAHLAVSDVQEGKYHHADRLNRAGPGLAGATPEKVWNEDWTCVRQADGFVLKAADRDFSLDLELKDGRPPVIHGAEGISQKGATPGNASHYYSLTRMPTRGSIQVGGRKYEVTGASWMDHEFGTSFLEKGTRGWDWFSAQLDDGSELMLFQLRQEDGRPAPGNAGTLVRADGTVRPLTQADFTLKPGTATWRSPAGGVYPLEWEISIPGEKLALACKAAMPAQEFRAESTPGLGYWEGAVDYSGTAAGRPVTGRGYLEMTGYSGQSMSVWFGDGR